MLALYNSWVGHCKYPTRTHETAVNKRALWWTWAKGNEHGLDSGSGAEEGLFCDKENGEGHDKFGEGQRRKNLSPCIWPGMKATQDRISWRERLWRPYAFHWATRTDGVRWLFKLWSLKSALVKGRNKAINLHLQKGLEFKQCKKSLSRLLAHEILSLWLTGRFRRR